MDDNFIPAPADLTVSFKDSHRCPVTARVIGFSRYGNALFVYGGQVRDIQDFKGAKIYDQHDQIGVYEGTIPPVGEYIVTAEYSSEEEGYYEFTYTVQAFTRTGEPLIISREHGTLVTVDEEIGTSDDLTRVSMVEYGEGSGASGEVMWETTPAAKREKVNWKFKPAS